MCICPSGKPAAAHWIYMTVTLKQPGSWQKSIAVLLQNTIWMQL